MKDKLPIFLAVGTIVAMLVSAVLRQYLANRDSVLHGALPPAEHLYALKSDSNGKTYSANTPTWYSFSISDEDGRVIKDFAVTHTKPMHVIEVRKDLAYFEHMHPDFSSSTGMFSFKDLTFPANGDYRLFADFAIPDDGQVTLHEDVKVGTTYDPVSVGATEDGGKVKDFDEYQVSLTTQGPLLSGVTSMLTFRILRNGKTITDLEPYLGALGHSVILREDSLDFIHTHPIEGDYNETKDVQNSTNSSGDWTQNGTVNFMVNFPKPGKYKAFTQFQRGGKVFTTDFVISVAQGPAQNRGIKGIFNTDHALMHK